MENRETQRKEMDENEFDAVSEDFKITVASIISSKPEKIQGMENLQ